MITKASPTLSRFSAAPCFSGNLTPEQKDEVIHAANDLFEHVTKQEKGPIIFTPNVFCKAIRKKCNKISALSNEDIFKVTSEYAFRVAKQIGKQNVQGRNIDYYSRALQNLLNGKGGAIPPKMGRPIPEENLFNAMRTSGLDFLLRKMNTT